MRLYLASPLGFAASTRAFLTELVCALEAASLTVHDPWGSNREKTAPSATPLPEPEHGHPSADPAYQLAARHARNLAIGWTNEEAIRAADGLVAVLDGVDVDSGTASEVGFAYALGKPIWGLRTDTRRTGDNEAAIVNLQVHYFVEASGGQIVHSIPALVRVIAEADSAPTQGVVRESLAAWLGGEPEA